ncbi:MAG: hypothetical protein VXX30_06515 [Planctomycetota bacterium]|nr:hypothetical protein [Planctomycetota bacterium]
MPPEELRRRFDRLESGCIRRRDRRIDRLVTVAERRGEDPDRHFWSIVHDLEHVPTTNLRARLRALGLELPSVASLADLGPREVDSILANLLEALSLLEVRVRGHHGLDPRDLLARLLRHVVDHPVPDLPVRIGDRMHVRPTGGGLAIASACHPALAPPPRPRE